MPVIRLRLYLFITIVFLFLYLVFQRSQSSRFDLYPPLATNSSLGWGVATRVSVISLPKRSDRRASLSPLWKAHRHYNIQYINATSVEAPEVDHIMEHVRRERRMERAGLDDQGLPSPRRPSFNDGLGKDPNQLWGSDLWTTDPPLPDEDVLDPDRLFPIPAEQGNPFNPHRLPTPSNVRKSYVLSRAMVACWHSHLQAIHQIAISRPSPLETYIILEDDVDFEWEIKTILTSLWKSLPNDWEMVMLGHCWSDETRHPPVFELVLPSANVSLHPSYAPLCTHAYALSSRGAINLYNHLRHSAFAYSRALDQAIAWLIRTGNLKGAYSIVPSLVIQTKDSKSDISERKRGSRWRDTLVDSTRQRLQGSTASKWRK